MQESNLSSKIVPNLRDGWSFFVAKVEKNLSELIGQFNKDKQRIRDLERVINKINEITNASKDDLTNILKYRELFMYVDNSLESSFDALDFFREQNNFDNNAVKSIYNRIINSPEIIKLTSEYHSLSIKIEFDKERIKRLSSLVNGSKVDYTLITELVKKYKIDNNKKKDILLYPVVMLSIKQKEISDNKTKEMPNVKEKFLERFKTICNDYYARKEDFNDLLFHCYSIREKMDYQELNTFNSFINNPSEIEKYNPKKDTIIKVYTLAFFKIKKDIEKLIDSISDMDNDEYNDDDLIFLEEVINEFSQIGNKLNSLDNAILDENNNKNNNVFFLLDAFNRLIINDDIIKEQNISNLKALIEKLANISNAKIEGVKTYHMLGVDDLEKILGKNISMLTTSKMRLAYVTVGKSILIIQGSDTTSNRFDKDVKIAITRNIVPIRKQIELIQDNDIDYIELQNKILSSILEHGEKEKTL